jgi:predicted small lipoprotein YifL
LSDDSYSAGPSPQAFDPTGRGAAFPQTSRGHFARLDSRGSGADPAINQDQGKSIMNIHKKYLPLLLLGAVLGSGLTACEKKGPVEQAAEEVDEAIDTAKDGKESVATKVDDAVDELREKK